MRGKNVLWNCLLTWLLSAAGTSAIAQEIAAPRFKELTSLEAWILLPEAVEGAGEVLPAWARVLAGSLPNTTARMLELDWLHRERSPLDPQLRCKLRWIVAKANRCDYSLAYAEADLLRAGLTPDQILALARWAELEQPAERSLLDFAHKLTLTADAVTDEEVAQLVKRHGEKNLVAIVLLIAHANFQDRLFLSLGVKVEPDGPLAPVKVRFARGEKSRATNIPKREAPAQVVPEPSADQVADAPWLALDVPALEQKMQAQQQRSGRIRVPTWEEISRRLPPEVRNRPPLKIRWSLVCNGYQPELAGGWGACMGTFGEEARQDRVFEESLFWVITRELNCFY